jgi:hypothetical protein
MGSTHVSWLTLQTSWPGAPRLFKCVSGLLQISLSGCWLAVAATCTTLSETVPGTGEVARFPAETTLSADVYVTSTDMCATARLDVVCVDALPHFTRFFESLTLTVHLG